MDYLPPKRKDMKIMISYPPLRGKGSPMLTQNRQFQWYNVGSYIFPVVPAYAATILSQNKFNVIWNDSIAEGLKYNEFLKLFKKEKPDIIAMETKTPVVKLHWEIINEIKELIPECKVVLMGDHVTAFPKESLTRSKVDYVIEGGDYDISLLGIAKSLRDKVELPGGVWYKSKSEENGCETFIHTGEPDRKYDLNKLPFIDRILTKAHLYGEKWKKGSPFFYTMAGRDCPWRKCTFCSWTTLYPEFNIRTPENLLDEIGYLIDEYGAKEIFDDTGTFPGGSWLDRFCNGMIERGYNKEILFSCNMRFDYLNAGVTKLMKKAGFRKIKAGLESANQKTLDLLNKGIKVQDIKSGCENAGKAGIDVHLTVMVGYPWETREDTKRTIKMARRLMAKGYAEMLQSTVVIPYPGTPLFKMALEKNWFNFDPYEYERYDMREAVLKTPDMSPDEIFALCQDVYKSFFSPGYVFRRAIKIRSYKDIKYTLNGVRAVIGHIKDFKI